VFVYRGRSDASVLRSRKRHSPYFEDYILGNWLECSSAVCGVHHSLVRGNFGDDEDNLEFERGWWVPSNAPVQLACIFSEEVAIRGF
jgi:hypothetical protein